MISLLKRIAFLSLLLSMSLCFWACDDPDDTGLDIRPQLDVKVQYSDTATIVASTIMIDSVNTSNTNLLTVGQYIDPSMGKIKATSYFNVISAASINYGTNPKMLKTTLTLTKTYSYGDTTALQKISVHLLKDRMDSTAIFYNDPTPGSSPTANGQQLTYLPDMIGEYAYNPSNLAGNKIEIPLADEFAQKLFQARSENEIDALIKGIALVSEEGDAIIGYDASNNLAATIDIHYKNKEFEDQEKVYQLQLLTPHVYDNKLMTVRCNHITIDRTGTTLSPLTKPYDKLSSDLTSQQLYMQSCLGIMIKLDFPYIKDYNKLGEMALNRAELVIPVVDRNRPNFYKYPSSLELIIPDQDGKVQRRDVTRNNVDNFGNLVNYHVERILRKLPKEGYSPLSIPLNQDQSNLIGFVPLNRSYNANITSYIQFVLNAYKTNYQGTNKIDNFGLVITPLYYNMLVERVIIRGPKASQNPLKLKLYYTSIK